jgi:hypothetical protein
MTTRSRKPPVGASERSVASPADEATASPSQKAQRPKPGPELFDAPISRRFLPTFDPIDADEEQFAELSDAEVDQLVAARLADVTHFRVGLGALKLHADTARQLAPQVRQLPQQVRGRILNADGSAAVRVAVLPTLPGSAQGLGRAVMTDELGLFTLPLPPVDDAQRRTLLADGLGLRIRGGENGVADLVVPLPRRGQQALGELTLRSTLRPMPQSIIGALVDLVEDLPAVTGGGLSDGSQAPVRIQLGQDACNIRFEEDAHLRRFPFRTLVRLIEPRTTTVNQVLVFQPHGPASAVRGKALMSARFNRFFPVGRATATRFVERVPVDKPISVDGFRDQLIGVSNNRIGAQRGVPMASTLGLGYVLNMAQVWKYDGLTLGNLLYSLPLAPGEQQRIAVSERRATASVRDSERLSLVEQQQSSLQEDASTSAVFESAFNERVTASNTQGGEARSSGGGIGGLLGAVVGGVAGFFAGGPAGALALGTAGGAIGASVGASIGGVGSSGSSRSSLSGARSFTSRAAEEMHRSVERQASARRLASRTAIRLATATESETVTTKVITNHNKMHALTIQYWEVLRKFVSTTEVEGCTLVCFVPLDLVRFLPAGQALSLISEASVDTRAKLVVRFSMLHRHSDAIRPWLPARHREGLRLLEEFVANTRADVNLAGPSSNTLNFSLDGYWLPFERLTVQPILRDGRRLRAVQLVSSQAALEQKKFGTREALMAELVRRRSAVMVTMEGNLFLPQSVDPADVVGFELSRRFDALHYQFDLELIPEFAALKALKDSGLLKGVDLSRFEGSARLQAAELEAALRGPRVQNFIANFNGVSNSIAADSIDELEEFPVSGLAIPATERDPVLGFRDVMKIERTLQHVVRNTLSYSKAVWASLNPEERVVMLEGYTLGLPETGLDVEGLTDPSQHVPLLNCVANQVLGFHGNCMIMPFSIPASLAVMLNRDAGDDESGDATREPLTTAAVQDALTEFHREGFSPPESRFTLPTRGLLGEAVLGQCAAAEKIDLTRFWNWQDSPAPQATDIGNVGFRGGGVGELGSPNALASMPQIVNNVGEGGALGALAQALAARGGDATPFAAEFASKNVDAAGAARSGALTALTDLSKQAMNTGLELFKAQTAADKAKAAEAKGGGIDAAVKDLKDNAAAYLAGAGQAAGTGGDTAAGVFAASKILALTGGAPLPRDKADTLLAAYDKSEGGTRTVASTAWLTALGLIP